MPVHVVSTTANRAPSQVQPGSNERQATASAQDAAIAQLLARPTFAESEFPDVLSVSHPDDELAKLMPALQAAIHDRDVAGDWDLDTPANDPAYRKAVEHRRNLDAAVAAIADEMLALRPRTLTGLLLTAHAASAISDWLWEDEDRDEADLEPAERGLRAVCNSLFSLFGVDQRGKYIGGRSTPETDPAADAAILRMLVRPAAPAPDEALLALRPALDAAESHWLTRRESFFHTHAGLPDHAETEAAGNAAQATLDDVADSVLEHDPRTLQGLVLSARAIAARHEYIWESAPDDLEGGEATLKAFLDRFLAVAGIDWRGRPLSGEVTSPVQVIQPDPIFAAIEASRVALDAHIIACEAPDADSAEGDARRTAAGSAAYQAWRALLATTPTTAAGAQALALRAIDQLERDGCWNDSEKEVDARTLFRAIAAVGAPGSSAPRASTERDPVLAAAAVHREAHIAMLAARTSGATAFDAALQRKDDAVEALIRTRPATETGWRVYTTTALFEIVRCLLDAGTVPNGWTAAAGCVLNGSAPLTEDTLPPAVDCAWPRGQDLQQPVLMAAE